MMSRRNGRLLKILLSLFLLNSISLYFYFSHPDSFLHHKYQKQASPGNRRRYQSEVDHRRLVLPSTPAATSHLFKPWPILPSYLPWSLNPSVPLRSCEAFFGNGFTRRLDLLSSSPFSSTPGLRRRSEPSAAGGGWFRCHHSETLRSSICEGGRIRMLPEKIRMSAGGEDLDAVIGRDEDSELPEFEFGAFDLEGSGGNNSNNSGKKLVNKEFLDQFVPVDKISKHTVRELIDSIRVSEQSEFQCSQWIEEPVLLVTRFEYANLFHTVTDWYSGYVASRVTGLPNRPHVVFLDGHCKTPLEETWKALFSSIRYAKNFTGPVCFRHAILCPLGYETSLFKGLSQDINCEGALSHDLWQHPDDRKTARLSEFGEMVRAAFGFPVDRHHTHKPVAGHNVLFVRREDYLAHPRHTGKVQSRLSNEEEVYDALRSWVSNHSECKANLINGLFAHMTMKEQVRAIQDASVIIGAHGAGMTHIISALPKTVVLEIISSDYRRPHFALIAQWKGLQYHAINLAGSYANPTTVVSKLNNILRSIGC